MEDIKVGVADALAALFADKKFVGSLADKTVAAANGTKVKNALAEALKDDSKEFIKAAKDAGVAAVTKHCKAPLADFAKTHTEPSNLPSKCGRMAKRRQPTSGRTPALAVGKGSSGEVSESKLSAAANKAAKANNEKIKAMIQTEVDSQTELLKAEFEARCDTLMSNVKTELDTRVGSLFQSIEGGMRSTCQYVNEAIKENCRLLDEPHRSIAGRKRGAGSASPDPSPKRRSPRKHDATRRNDERDEATTNRALTEVDGNALMKFAAAMGTAMSQGNANQARVSEQAPNNLMSHGTQSMGSFMPVPQNMMMPTQGAGASSMGMMQTPGGGCVLDGDDADPGGVLHGDGCVHTAGGHILPRPRHQSGCLYATFRAE